MRRRLLTVALLIVLAAAGCAARATVTLAPWRAPLNREHPLTGRIWDVRGERFVTADELAARLASARYVLLGEKHDNPDHHEVQAALVRALLRGGRRPAVALEMLTADQAPAIARHVAGAPRDAAGLAEAVDWKRSGWPEWAYYQPIVQAALDAGVPVIAANLAPATARSLARGEAGALPSDLAARYALDRPLPPASQARLTAEIREAHCGDLPPARVESMALAQRARDATLADSLVRADGDGGVLIAGVGHVRADHGVPVYLASRAPGAPVAVVAPLEVTEGRDRPQDYAAQFDGALPFDFVWFTPRMDNADPCERFRLPRASLRLAGPEVGVVAGGGGLGVVGVGEHRDAAGLRCL
jgi:uncharacterized iron-regulated protein